jgi:hypothetical protein
MLQSLHFSFSSMANRHNTQGNHSEKAYQHVNQGKIDKPIAATVIAPIIKPIPKLIRNIRHHIPQANFQVGLTSLSICSFSFPCFVIREVFQLNE